MTHREISNRMSGAKTQLKRATDPRRRAQLTSYLLQLTDQRERLPLEARLAELDARWDTLVDRVAASYKASKADVAWRNGQARKRARRGLGPLTTCRAEARDYAERQILAAIDRHEGEPHADRARAEITEACDLRDELERRAEIAA